MNEAMRVITMKMLSSSRQGVTVILSVLCLIGRTAVTHGGSVDQQSPKSRSESGGSASDILTNTSRPLSSTVQPICHQYVFKRNGICKDVLGDSKVNKTVQEQTTFETNLNNVFSKLNFIAELLLTRSINELKPFALMFRINITAEAVPWIRKLQGSPDVLRQCLDNARRIYCHAYFPVCQVRGHSIKILPLCRKACRLVKKQVCKEVLALIKALKLRTLFDYLKCHVFPRTDAWQQNCLFPIFHITKGNGSRNISTRKIQIIPLTTETVSFAKTNTTTRRTISSTSRNIELLNSSKKKSLPISAPSIKRPTNTKSKKHVTKLTGLGNITATNRTSTGPPQRITPPSLYCKKYSYFFKNRPESICKGIFANDYLYYWRDMNYTEEDNGMRRLFEAAVPLGHQLLVSNENSVSSITELIGSFGPMFALQFKTLPTLAHYAKCVTVAKDFACYGTFETCDYSANNPTPKFLCREACEFIQYDICEEEIMLARRINTLKRKYPKSFNLNKYHFVFRDCWHFPQKKPGNAHTCLIPDYFLAAEMKKNTTDTCYENSGYRYRGDINVTKSGYDCQNWSSQSPHTHRFYTETFPELINAGNKCRNPRRFGYRPWCFTQNANIRWEYCDVAYCPVDGMYSPWSEFGSCNAICGRGFQIRTRLCTSPEHGGRNCSSIGPDSEIKYCQIKPCPVNGGYSEWLNGKCNASCGNASYKIQSRECMKPRPMYDGKDCSQLGPPSRLVKCDTSTCGDVVLPDNGQSLSVFGGEIDIIIWPSIAVLGVLTIFGLFVTFVRNRKYLRSLCSETSKYQEDNDIEPYYTGEFTSQHIGKVMIYSEEEKLSASVPRVQCKLEQDIN